MRRLFFTVLIVVALPGVAFAQPAPPKMTTGQGPVSSFAQLNTQLKAGDTVWVIDATGHEFEGKVRAVGLRLVDPGTRGRAEIHGG